MRTFLTIILPLIAPTVVFFVWQWFARRKAEAEARHEALRPWQTWPWAKLSLAGAVLTALTLSAVAMMRDNPMGARYVPPRIENGELIPGHFVEPGADDAQGAGGNRDSKTFHGLGTAPPSLPNRSKDDEP